MKGKHVRARAVAASIFAASFAVVVAGCGPDDLGAIAPVDGSTGPDGAGPGAKPDARTDVGADARSPESGAPDTGEPDTGNPETGTPDTGTDTGADTGTPDAGADAGIPDTGTPDTGARDATTDTGAPDTGIVDSGVDATIPVDSGADADSGAVSPTGETCETAIPIATPTSAPVLLAGQSSVGYASNYNGGTNCTAGAGPDRVYSVTVPAGRRLRATVTPIASGPGSFDATISFVAGPDTACNAAPRVCLASSDSGGSGASDALAYVNKTGAALTIFVVVDGYSSTSFGGYDLAVAVDPVPQGDACQNAIPVATSGTTPVTIRGDSTAGFTNDYAGGTDCGSTSGLDRVYSVDVPAGRRLFATVAPAAGETEYDPNLSLVVGTAASCDAIPRVCAASDIAGSQSDLNFVRYQNTTGSTQTVFVHVDASITRDVGGPFDLTVVVEQPAADDVCTGATVIAGSGTLTNQTTVGYGNDYNSGTGCGSTSGVDRAYTVTVPDGYGLAVAVTPTTPNYDASISLAEGPASACAASPRVCVAADDTGPADQTNRVAYRNRTGAPKAIFVVIDSAKARDLGGTFTLVTSLQPIPADDICAGATAIPGAGTLTGQSTIGYANDYIGGTNCGATSGADRIYSLSVPAGQAVSVSVTPTTPGYDPAIALISGPIANCTAASRTCITANNSGVAADTNTVVYGNSTGGSVPLYVVIDSAVSNDVGGEFTLTTALSPIAADDTCAGATVIAASGTLTNQTTVGYINDYTGGTGCTSTGGLDRVYVIDLPAGQVLSATVTPTVATYDPSIMIVEGPAASCAAPTRVCLAADDIGGDGAPDTVTYRNRTGAAKQLYVVVDSGYANVGAAFSLTTSVTPMLSGEACSTAPMITAGTLSNQTTTGYNDDYRGASPCTGTAGADRVYAIDVPQGQLLTATVTPTGTWDPSINLVAGPAAMCEAAPLVCLAGADSGFDGDPDTVNYRNTTGAARTVYILVDTYRDAVFGDFSLTTTLAP